MVQVEENSIILSNLELAGNSSLVVIGIPAFNEERCIAKVVLDAQKFAHIVLVCDDGSSDLTARIAERLGADVVKHDKNMGYGSALQSLFKRARELGADILVTIDADGQHNANEIPRLIKPLEEHAADVVLGSRFIDDEGTADMPLYRKVGIKVITKLVNGSTKTGVSDAQSGFRAYNKHALDCVLMSETGMSASIEVLRAINSNGLKTLEVPITCKYADSLGEKTSTENPIKHGVSLVMSIVRLIVEERPLVALGIPSIICLFTGLFFGVWMLQIYTITHTIVTNIALASLAFIIIGFFMLSTSITLYSINRISDKITKKSP